MKLAFPLALLLSIYARADAPEISILEPDIAVIKMTDFIEVSGTICMVPLRRLR